MTVINQSDDLEAIIARTALKYDLLPYQSKPFAQSQPARLGAIARLFGLEAAPMETARVLELGCASGGNIIPHAARYPNAKFVGVDLARTQVAAGRARIKALGLSNIEILCQSITEIGDELGTFDYIICHGVFSWVPAPVQEAIFAIIRARLSAVGVACVSYNVLPGWRMLQPLRDAFLLQIPDQVDSLARVAKARELLMFLRDSTPDKGPYGDMLRAWATRLTDLPDDYIAHEFLEETNSPSTVRDFTSSAARHGLAYLGECELASMILDNYGEGVASAVGARTNNDFGESEQFIDLLSGRTFRQSLLFASERADQISRALEPSRVSEMHFIAPSGMKIEQDGTVTVLTDTAGRTLRSESAAVKAGIERLLARFPASSSLGDCAEGQDEKGRAQICDALYRMLAVGMIQIMSEPAPCAIEPGNKPTALPLARADAKEGASFTTNVRHETVSIDPAGRALLPALDGTRTHSALEAVLVAEGLAGRLSFTSGGKPATGKTEIETIAAEYLPGLLSDMARAGLLVDTMS